MNTFQELGLDARLVKSVEALGFVTPTPIQLQAIPALLEGGRDLVGLAQTGTGKTFTISGVSKDPVLKGIMPRAFESVFSQINSDTDRQYLVRVSYLEIY